MTVFTWKGEKDNNDLWISIRYYKHFQSGLMAMEPQTGKHKSG
jgi:hypothetical protein